MPLGSLYQYGSISSFAPPAAPSENPRQQDHHQQQRHDEETSDGPSYQNTDQKDRDCQEETIHVSHSLLQRQPALPSVSVEVTNYDDHRPSRCRSTSARRSGIVSSVALTVTVTTVAILFLLSGSAPFTNTSNNIESESSSHHSSSALNEAVNNLLGNWLNFEGVLAGGGDDASVESGGGNWLARIGKEDNTALLPPCEYIDHPFFVAPALAPASAAKEEEDYDVDGGHRELVGIQTSKKEPGQQWSEFGCNKRTGRGSDIIVPGSDAANIVIDLPSTSSSNADESSQKFQKILGFGGSITEATTLNWKSLSSVARDRVLELLYGDSGLGYTLGRVPMGSCDFSVSSYNFAEKEDLTLDSFDKSVQRDYDNGMIDMIKSARYVTQHSWEGGIDLSLVASPWSPPPWMKQPLPTDPVDATHAKTMQETALPECLREGTGAESRYARAWARYFSEFISAYKGRGIDFWAVTVQNEPLSLPKFEACGHSKTTEKEFVVNHLGPVLNEDHPNVKILAYDTNKDQCVDFMEHFWGGSDAFEDAASKYIDGAALHWYSRLHSSLDGGEGAPNMHRLKALASRRDLEAQKDAAEDKDQRLDTSRKVKTKPNDNTKEPILLDTEATHCTSTGYAIGNLNISWQRAERNAHAILSQLAAGSNGWIEWNMILDPFGGPNHVENFCDAPLVAVPHRAEGLSDFIQPVPSFERHQLQDGESIKGEYETKFSLSSSMGYPISLMNIGIVVQPMYYYMGHISRYVRPGSRPLRAIVDESTGGASSRAFRPTGRIEPGGGYNSLAHDGTEVTFWPCEGSTRQSWSFNYLGELQMVQYNHKKNNMECVSLAEAADPDLGGILLTHCGGPNSGFFDMVEVEGSTKHAVKFYSRKFPDACLGITPLANNGGSYGPRGGAQATMLPCNNGSTIWSFTPEGGEVTSAFFEEGDVCMTTGWPFLQAGVFDTTEVSEKGSRMSMVVLNESADDAAFVVRLNDKKANPLLKSSIPAHSIQTFSV